MLQLLLYIIPSFIVYLFIRATWVSNEALKTKYKLARLRDELTWLAIEGEINRENKQYAHLYNNIEKMMQSLNSLNFWVMFYFLLKEKHQISINEIEKVRIDVEKNKNFKAIYESYYKLLITYVARKNFLMVLLTFPFWKSMLASRLSINEHDVNIKNNNAKDSIDAQEYSSFAFYINSISPKSLLVRQLV